VKNKRGTDLETLRFTYLEMEMDLASLKREVHYALTELSSSSRESRRETIFSEKE